MNSPSVVSMTVMPAVNRIGRHKIAVSKPRPNTTPTGYSCHSLVMAFIQRPKIR